MDEFLCEYVDDTMDCSVRAAFEECLECDSRLAQRVKRLRGTRSLLSQYSFQTPKDLRKKVRRRLTKCLPFASPVRPPHASVLIGTATSIILAAGLVAGTSQNIIDPVSVLQTATSPIAETEIMDTKLVKGVEGKPLTEFSPPRALSSVV